MSNHVLREYSCQECGDTYQSCQRRAGKDGKYRCKLCSKIYTDNARLKGHKTNCEQCNKSEIPSRCSDGVFRCCYCTMKRLDHLRNTDEGRLKARDAFLRHEYGPDFGLEAYGKMFDAQRGLCKICDKPAPIGEWLEVDHNHITGKIRGLLCKQHNIGLGNFQTDETGDSLLMRAASYMREHG